MAVFLAIDAGGTKTDYVLADEHNVLATVRGGTLKRMRADAATTSANLQAALDQLTALSGIPLQHVDSTCVGTAGNTVPLVTDWLRQAFAERISGAFLLTGDVDIALDAAFQGGPGVLVLAGTGSNVAGRGPHGPVMGAGGWGPALADQGSGHRIGLEALRAAFLALDEGRETSLLPAVGEFWQLATESALIEYANRTPSPDFSRLTHLVLAAAENGDDVAQAVLCREGQDLGYLTRLMIRRIAAQSPQAEATPVTVAFAGSILQNVAPVRTALIAAVQSEFPHTVFLPGVIDPLDGALWRARRHLLA
jgi:glucosamine kinase